MFAKLLKHEWKATARILTILSACVLGIAILGGLDLRLIIAKTNDPSLSTLSSVLMIPAFLFVIFAYLGIIGYIIGTYFILLHRFYKSRFTDEGYLTFTLPVKTSHIFLASAVNMMIWQLIAGVVLAISIFAMVLLALPAAEFNEFILAFRELPTIFAELSEAFSMTSLITLPITWISGVVIPMTAIVIGAVIAKKHKILAAIGVYYGTTVLSNILTSMISAIVTVNAFQGSADIDMLMQISPLVTALIPALLAAGGYFLSIHLMKRKLNLP